MRTAVKRVYADCFTIRLHVQVHVYPAVYVVKNTLAAINLLHCTDCRTFVHLNVHSMSARALQQAKFWCTVARATVERQPWQ